MAAEGLITVSVMVPVGQAEAVKAFAASLRTRHARRTRKEEVRASRTISAEDRAMIRAVYGNGGSYRDVSLPGFSLEDIARSIAGGDYGTAEEVRRELLARERAEQRISITRK